MLADASIRAAVSEILQRSERQPDADKVRATFVDVGIASQLENRNNQLVFGRRGTGKTHILRILEQKLALTPTNAVLYIDARTLGSTSQFSDSSIAIPYRCTALFRDILSEIHNALREHLVHMEDPGAHASLELLSRLAQVATEPVEAKADERVASTERHQEQRESTLNASVSVEATAAVSGSLGRSTTRSKEVNRSYAVQKCDKVVFPEVRSLLTDILKGARSTLFLLVDEWSSLPVDIQPFLAEFFKRAFFPNPHIVVKIAALEFRSAFNSHLDGGQLTGFELGADVSSTLDIDDYYVFDRNPIGVANAFAEMLLRHIGSELPPHYLRDKYEIETAVQLRDRLFASPEAFDDLVRASEGVARDMINVFSTAYFDCGQKARASIHLKAVEEAARQWYEQDKVRNLDEQLRKMLSRLVDNVIGKRHARSFLVPRELEKHPVIQRLFDARILHLVLRGYADKETPGTRYNIYTLDYGTYVDLRQTSKSPERELFSAPPSQPELPLVSPEDQFIVPFDDKRSIRRIVLSRDVLE